MSELSQRKFPWSNGFRDYNTKQVIKGYDLDRSYMLQVHGIPRSMLGVTMENLDPKNEKQLLIANRMWEMIHTSPSPLTMLITGGNGTGKTWLGCALVHTLARFSSAGNCKDYYAYYTNEAAMLTLLSGYEGSVWFNRLTQAISVLVIDEFAMTQWTPADKRKIEQVLNIRYGNGLKTIILTNRRSDELYGRAGGAEAILSSQIRSRFLPGYNIELTGADLRQGNTLPYEDEKNRDDPF